MAIKSKRFDYIFSNPPYNDNLDIKILHKIISISDEIIVVHPSTWLLDRKNKNATFKNFKVYLGKTLKEVKMFNGNPVFGIELQVPIIITHISNSHNNKTTCDYFGDKFIANVFDITKFGNDWDMVKDFLVPVKKYINTHGSIHDYVDIADFTLNKFSYAQLATITGHVWANKLEMSRPDHYTLVTKDANIITGIRNSNHKNVYKFSTDYERDNFIAYLQTKFTRFCLATMKVSLNNGGETINIPMMDFSQEWDDNKLFDYFNVSDEMKEFIDNYIPSYHVSDFDVLQFMKNHKSVIKKLTNKDN